MADTKKPEPTIGTLKGSGEEAKKSFRADATRRANATNILSDIQLGDEFGDAVLKELKTTMGGELRPITAEDLAQFRRRVGVIRSRSTIHQLKGGIRPQQVIAFAKPSPNVVGLPQKGMKTDIGRANDQIHMCVLAGANKGLLRFITNASGTTKGVYRHHVKVRLMAFDEAVAMPKAPKKERSVGNWLANQPVKFECDCGRHTFWFRYLASIGGWSEGRIENGYPKERNPNLMGIACKHVLRVMRELTTSTHLHEKLGKMVYAPSHITRTSQKEAERRAKQQKRKPLTIDHDSARKAVKKLKEKMYKEAQLLKTERRNQVGADQAKKKAISQAEGLFKLGILSKKQFDQAIAKINETFQ